MYRCMYASSRTSHDVYLSCMSLCIIMLELFICSLFFSIFLLLFRVVGGFSSHFWMLLIAVAFIGKIKQ